jgi:membrane protein DedA with SNARE-associated domain
MLEFILKLFDSLGYWGLFLGLAVEASSLPFPGVLLVLTYGYLLKPSWGMILTLSFFGSLVYTFFSYIPYFIGLKLQGKLKKKKYEKKIEKVQTLFKKYGEWSISFSRIVGIGNYISYFSGMSKVPPWKFGVLTYIGVLLWVFLMFLLGRIGNINTVIDLFTSMQKYILLGILLSIFFYMLYRMKKKTEKNTNLKKSKNNI